MIPQKWACNCSKKSTWMHVTCQKWAHYVSFLNMSLYSITNTEYFQIWICLFWSYFEYTTYSILTHFVSSLRNHFFFSVHCINEIMKSIFIHSQRNGNWYKQEWIQNQIRSEKMLSFTLKLKIFNPSPLNSRLFIKTNKTHFKTRFFSFFFFVVVCFFFSYFEEKNIKLSGVAS